MQRLDRSLTTPVRTNKFPECGDQTCLSAMSSSGATRVEIRRGERLPDTLEVEEFPETIYRDAPSLREYRYIHRENRTYLVEPTERRVIEEID
jgi:hypothetical protein